MQSKNYQINQRKEQVFQNPYWDLFNPVRFENERKLSMNNNNIKGGVLKDNSEKIIDKCTDKREKIQGSAVI